MCENTVAITNGRVLVTGGVTPIDPIVTAATALSQQSNHPNRCSQRSKWYQKDSQRSDPSAERTQITVQQSALNQWVGFTCTESLFPDIQACGLRLQFKYRDSFSGKISERSKVNGQKLAWSTVKPPKRDLTRGHSCDYRVYGSDTPLGVRGVSHSLDRMTPQLLAPKDQVTPLASKYL